MLQPKRVQCGRIVADRDAQGHIRIEGIELGTAAHDALAYVHAARAEDGTLSSLDVSRLQLMLEQGVARSKHAVIRHEDRVDAIASLRAMIADELLSFDPATIDESKSHTNTLTTELLELAVRRGGELGARESAILAGAAFAFVRYGLTSGMPPGAILDVATSAVGITATRMLREMFAAAVGDPAPSASQAPAERGKA